MRTIIGILSLCLLTLVFAGSSGAQQLSDRARQAAETRASVIRWGGAVLR
jgi:hypothetical protein